MVLPCTNVALASAHHFIDSLNSYLPFRNILSSRESQRPFDRSIFSIHPSCLLRVLIAVSREKRSRRIPASCSCSTIHTLILYFFGHESRNLFYGHLLRCIWAREQVSISKMKYYAPFELASDVTSARFSILKPPQEEQGTEREERGD